MSASRCKRGKEACVTPSNDGVQPYREAVDLPTLLDRAEASWFDGVPEPAKPADEDSAGLS